MSPAGGWYPSRYELRGRELGRARPAAFASRVARRRVDAATLSGDKTFAHKWAGGINCLELDETERRYLLVGTVDAVVAVYDTEQPTAVDPNTGDARHGASRRIDPLPPSRTGPTTTRIARGVPNLASPSPRSAHHLHSPRSLPPVAPLFRPCFTRRQGRRFGRHPRPRLRRLVRVVVSRGHGHVLHRFLRRRRRRLGHQRVPPRGLLRHDG